MRVNFKRGALLGTVAALAAGVVGPAGTASAGVLVKTTSQCQSGTLSQPFSAWGDHASYELAPGGSLEGGAQGWSLAGGAHVVSGNEPWKVHGSADSTSLELPSGSSATTGTICVGLNTPTVRFFARKNSGLLSTLTVSATVQLSVGGSLTLPFGLVLAGSSWTPTASYLFLANLLPIIPGEYTPVTFHFAPLLGGDWQIDDVYVDPFRKA
jgi:hypothetical protein